jgi:hypothetical protein
MQPTDVQVERTLAALKVEIAGLPAPSTSGRIPRDTLRILLDELPDGLLEDLEDRGSIREDRLEMARDRLEHGDSPSSDEIAGRIVGRLVCDRLR